MSDDGRRRLEAPVRKHDDVFAVVGNRLRLDGIDDERKVKAEQLLPTRMAVRPVRAALTHRESVGEGFTRRDAAEADARHAVHVGWQQHPVPVDRRDFLQAVGDTHNGVLAFAQPNHRPRHRAVDGHGLSRAAIDQERQRVNGQIDDAFDCCLTPRQRGAFRIGTGVSGRERFKTGSHDSRSHRLKK